MRRAATAAAGLVLAFLGGCVGPISPEAEGWIRSAAEALRRNDNPAAIGQADKVIAQFPRSEQTGEAHYIRGVARFRTGDAAGARQDLLESISLTRRKDLEALAHLELANIAFRAGDMAEAEGRLREVLAAVAPGSSPCDEAAFLLGSVLQRQGKWAQADILFDRVMHFFDGTPLAEQAAQRVHAVRWSVQAGAFDGTPPARELESRLIQAHLPARVDLALRDGKMLRLVLVGSYPDYAASEADLPKVKALAPAAMSVPAR